MVSGFGSKEALHQQSTPAYFIGPVCSIVWFCEMFLFCLFSHLFFPVWLWTTALEICQIFLNFCIWLEIFSINQTSILKKQAILNMYLDIIEGLDILGTNVFAWLWSTQECPQLYLDQSNSKILETPITQEKC